MLDMELQTGGKEEGQMYMDVINEDIKLVGVSEEDRARWSQIFRCGDPCRKQVPVQCLDDPFGFDAVVVYGHESFRLKQCTVFSTSYRTQEMATNYVNERPGAEAEDTSESGHQRQDMSSGDIRGQPIANQRPVRPEDTDVHNNLNHLLFTDGGPPLTMATGGTGYKLQQTESPVMLEKEEWDTHSRTRMKKGWKRGGKKSRRRHRR